MIFSIQLYKQLLSLGKDIIKSNNKNKRKNNNINSNQNRPQTEIIERSYNKHLTKSKTNMRKTNKIATNKINGKVILNNINNMRRSATQVKNIFSNKFIPKIKLQDTESFIAYLESELEKYK